MIKSIAIVGAGVMGTDTAFDIASYGYQVILKDINDDILEKAKKRAKENFVMVKMTKKGFNCPSIEEIMSRITFTLDYSGFESADIVIENIVENWDAKNDEYKRLRNVCKTDVIYAINTSCVPVTKIASLLPMPQKVIGVHFMNPVPLIKMVEVIRGYHTSSDTETEVLSFLKSLDKNPVVVNDSPGFVSNRLSHLFMNEAAFLVQEQIASPAEIDTIFKQGYGHKMGPLETADLIGIDTVVNSLDVLYECFLDSKFRCCPLLRKMADAGLLGRKSGKGFYEYRSRA
jgi:3-hydroxybutyryl-CoA dehydrogenase